MSMFISRLERILEAIPVDDNSKSDLEKVKSFLKMEYGSRIANFRHIRVILSQLEKRQREELAADLRKEITLTKEAEDELKRVSEMALTMDSDPEDFKAQLRRIRDYMRDIAISTPAAGEKHNVK